MKIEIKKVEEFIDGISNGPKWHINIYRNYCAVTVGEDYRLDQSITIYSIDDLIKIKNLIEEQLEKEVLPPIA